MKVSKPCGYELIWANTSDYIGKILFIEAGKRLSLQHHIKKKESLYVQSGAVTITLENQDGVFMEHYLRPKQCLHIPAGCKHRIAAQEDSEIFEVSTPHLDDVIRHEDDYGRI